MRPIDRFHPCKTGLTACALMCALVLTAAGILSTRADTLTGILNRPVIQAAGGDWQTVPAAPVGGQRINALLIDRAGRLWAGTEERGLAIWDGAFWRSLTTHDGLPDNRVLAVFEDAQGRVWAATGTGLGYASLDLAAGAMAFQRHDASELPSLPVLALAQAADGAIYMGTGAGLSRWQEDNDRLEPVPEFAGQRVSALLARRDGTLWAGTTSGLWRHNGGKWTAITAEDGPGARRIRGIVESSERMLYVLAEDNELWRSRGVAWERMELPQAIAAGITAIGTAEGRLWVGTHAGIWAHESPVWQQYDARWLPGPAATAFAGSPDGALWIGTGAGLVEYRPERTAPTVEIVAVNGMPLTGNAVKLERGRIESVEVAASDEATPPDRLILFTRLGGVDDMPQIHRGSTITAYSDRRLAAGNTLLHVWAQDEAFNRSATAEVTVITPDLVYLPSGLALRRETAYPILGAVVLLLAAGVTLVAATLARRRAVARAAAAEAARVQAVIAGGFNPYDRDAAESRSIDSRLPDGPVQEAVQALEGGNVLLLGAKGMGKTPILRRTANALGTGQSGDLVSLPAYLDLSSTRPDTMLHVLMERVVSAAGPLMVGERPQLQWHQTSPVAYGAREFGADLQLLGASLRPVVAPRRVRMVLLLDEAQVLDSYPPRAFQDARGILVGTMGGQMRAVLASEHALRSLDDLGDLFLLVELRPLSDAAARELVVEPVRGVYAWAPDAVDLVVRDAAGRTERLLEVAAACVRHALAARRIDITAEDALAATAAAR